MTPKQLEKYCDKYLVEVSVRNEEKIIDKIECYFPDLDTLEDNREEYKNEVWLRRFDSENTRDPDWFINKKDLKNGVWKDGVFICKDTNGDDITLTFFETKKVDLSKNKGK